VTIGVLLDVDSLSFSEVGTDGGDLVFDIHEESRLFLQVHLRSIEHALEEKAGG